MLKTTLSYALLLLAATTTASPIPQSGDGSWGDASGVNIINGGSGDTGVVISGANCTDRLNLCHEFCHIVQQTNPATDVNQCYDDCYRDANVECGSAGPMSSDGESTSTVGS
ncbi:hypothetical protein BJX76DRAFT_358027 [Aspergillus varians]